MTTRYERMKMQRRMQQRIRLVVEERRMAFAMPPQPAAEPAFDPEKTKEIRPLAALRPVTAMASVPLRAIGRVSVRPA